MLLLPERTAIPESSLSTGRCTQNRRTSLTFHFRLSMAKHGCDPQAACEYGTERVRQAGGDHRHQDRHTGAFNVHEVGIGMLYQSLQLMFAPLLRLSRVQQILR